MKNSDKVISLLVGEEKVPCNDEHVNLRMSRYVRLLVSSDKYEKRIKEYLELVYIENPRYAINPIQALLISDPSSLRDYLVMIEALWKEKSKINLHIHDQLFAGLIVGTIAGFAYLLENGQITPIQTTAFFDFLGELIFTSEPRSNAILSDDLTGILSNNTKLICESPQVDTFFVSFAKDERSMCLMAAQVVEDMCYKKFGLLGLKTKILTLTRATM